MQWNAIAWNPGVQCKWITLWKIKLLGSVKFIGADGRVLRIVSFIIITNFLSLHIFVDCMKQIQWPNFSLQSHSEDDFTVSLIFDQLLAANIHQHPGWLPAKTVYARATLILLFRKKYFNVNEFNTSFILKAATVQDDMSILVTVLRKPVKSVKQLVTSFRWLEAQWHGHHIGRNAKLVQQLKWNTLPP